MDLLTLVLTATAEPTPDPSAVTLNLNSIVGGGTGAALLALIIYVVKLILDRTIPSRSDSRASLSVVLEGLQSMVKVMQAEKDSDAKRLADRQARIDSLEEEADTNYVRKAEMQAEIIDLRSRVAQKDRHIKELIHLLTQMGAKVAGIDSETLDITLPTQEVKNAAISEQAKKDLGTSLDSVS